VGAEAASVMVGQMVPRDHYTWDLKCPKCGRTGVAHLSEEADPTITGLRFAVDELSVGFRVEHVGKTASDTVIYCVACNVAA
jgi:hypothetical protein